MKKLFLKLNTLLFIMINMPVLIQASDTLTLKETGTCYAMSDNGTKLYKVQMQANGSSLPSPEAYNLANRFNGEGSAYRASDHKIYAFKAKGDDRGPSDLYTIDIDTQNITRKKQDFIPGTVDGAEFYYDKVLKKEILYVISGETHSKLYAFDGSNWNLLEGYPKNLQGDIAGVSSIAIDPISGEAYGMDDYNYDHKRPTLYSIDLETAKTKSVVTLEKIADAEGLAYASDGNLYIEDEGHIDGRKIYQVDLTNGKLTPAAILGGRSDIEGLSCNGMDLAKVDATLSIEDAIVDEGDSGNSNLEFLVSLSKEVSDGVSFDYEILSGNDSEAKYNATEGEDYTGGTFHVSNITNTSKIIVKVKGDRKIESNEQLRVRIFNVQGALVGTDMGVGTIVNDDSNGLTAFDVDASRSNPVIKTKIVNKPFHLTLTRTEASNILDDMKHTKVKIVNSSACTQNADALDLNGFVDFNIQNKESVNQAFTVGKAMKSAKAQFYWETKWGEKKASCSSDDFSVRPDHFEISVSPHAPDTTLIAGKAFSIVVRAKDVNNALVTSYSGSNQATYTVEANETKVLSGCQNGRLEATPAAFVHGVSRISNARYLEVGEVSFTVDEAVSGGYATVDSKDTPDSMRLIKKSRVNANKFEVSNILLTTNFGSDGADGFTFYAGKSDKASEINKMAAKLRTSVTVVNALGATVENFRQGCYAKDVSISVDYDAKGQMGLIPELYYSDTKDATNHSIDTSAMPNTMASPLAGNNSFSYVIQKDLFDAGKGTQSVGINFERAKNKPLNPLSMKITGVNASLAGSGILDTKVPLTPETTFIYLRANVPSPQTHVGADHNITISYDVYSDTFVNRAEFGLGDLPESAHEVTWFTLDPNLSNHFDYGKHPRALHGVPVYTNPSGPSAITGNTLLLQYMNGHTLHITAPTLPYKNKIFYEPTMEYLKFDSINAAVNEHAFMLDFLPTKSKWSGKGAVGMTVDTVIDKKGRKSLDW